MERQHVIETTVAELARRMAPQWRFPKDWLAWPPDAFVFTSTVLRLTGCYRYVLNPGWVRGPTWQWDVERCAHQWLAHTDNLIRTFAGNTKRAPRFPRVEPLHTSCERLKSLADTVSLERLRTLSADDRDAADLAQALLTIHATADATCSGFGLIGRSEDRGMLTAYVANLLLTAYGSLSTLGKHQGLVLPKMRTPQSGLTLRSLSHHLTFHTSEVEVMWRALPWASTQENTINMLLVPWPSEVSDSAFKPSAETFAPVRYFQYSAGKEPDGLWAQCVDHLVAQVLRVNEQIGRLHLVVLPELALTRDQYHYFLLQLRAAHERSHHRLGHVPMVIAGVQVDDGVERDAEARRPPGGTRNEVFLATYFADRWYELSQRKHHRWKVDRNQVRQYRLEGRLATARHWYEQIPISQRRLTFVTSSGWLTLCPLICEDLAQLEPVSDVIRGVGPTLLTALLMDGPQLKERWSARYASVFADDPGTAVLTLTSTGMAARSSRLDGSSNAAPAFQTVGLWKDQPSGWKSLDLPRADDTLLLTISSGWAQEFTADGRSDHSSAAVFQFEGVRALSWKPAGDDKPGATGSPLQRSGSAADQANFRGWADIRELSAATFAIDALLQLRGRDADWILDRLLARCRGQHRAGRVGFLIALLDEALTCPANVGIDATTPADGWPTAELEAAAELMRRWPWRDAATTAVSTLDYWQALLDRARETLVDAANDSRRVDRVVALTTLSAIHARLEGFRWSAARPSQQDPRKDGRPGRTKPRPQKSNGLDPIPPEQRRIRAGMLLESIQELLEQHG
jgi:hypothetical protein